MNQHEINEEIEAFIHLKDGRKLTYRDEDLEFINRYSGAGGQGKHGATGEGVLYEFFTPEYVCEFMWKLAYFYGYDGGNVLEPSVATGKLLSGAPASAKCVGFEINPISSRICQLNFPKASIHTGYFETAFLQPDRFTSRIKTKELTWLKEYPFSLVIGNPPYGKYKNRYSSYFTGPGFPQIEQFFLYQGLQMLKKGGLLIYVISSNFLRNGMSYQKAKEEIFKIGELVDAFRLPPVFAYSDVPIDIVVLKRK